MTDGNGEDLQWPQGSGLESLLSVASPRTLNLGRFPLVFAKASDPGRFSTVLPRRSSEPRYVVISMHGRFSDKPLLSSWVLELPGVDALERRSCKLRSRFVQRTYYSSYIDQWNPVLSCFHSHISLPDVLRNEMRQKQAGPLEGALPRIRPVSMSKRNVRMT